MTTERDFEKLSEAMRVALQGWPDEGHRDRWIRERVLPALAEAGLAVVESGIPLVRALELRDGARAQCERRTAELAEAMVRLRIADRDATFGRAVLGLANEILRLHEMMRERPDAFSTDGSPASIAAVLSGELAEVAREEPRTSAAQRECGDVFAAAVHLLIAHDACLLSEIDAVVSKIEARLDAMDERGCTWAEAKEAVQLSTN